MRRMLTILIIQLAFSLSGIAQSSQDIARLMKNLDALGLDSIRVDTLNELAFILRVKDTLKSYTYAEEALKLAQRIPYRAGIASSYVVLGILSRNKADLQGASKYFESALDIREVLNNRNGVASCINNLASIKKLQGKHEEAKEIYLRGIRYLGVESNSMMLAKLYLNLGATYRRVGDFQASLSILDRSLAIYEENNSEINVAKVSLNLASTYLDIENPEKADFCAKMALKIFQKSEYEIETSKCYNIIGNVYFFLRDYNNAKLYYDSALLKKQNLPLEVKAVFYKNLGSSYLELGDFEKANQYYTLSVNEQEKLKNDYELALLFYNIGVFRARKLQYDQSILDLTESLSILKKSSNPLLEGKVLLFLASVYKKLEKPSLALEYNDKYLSLVDSLGKDMRAAITYKLNSTELLQQVTLRELELNKEKQKVNNMLWLTSSIILLVVVIIFIQRARLAKKKEEIGRKEIEELLIKKELEANYARIQGQESEQIRIARDLHDRLGSMLSTVKLFFSSIDSKIEDLKEENKKQYQKANTLLDDACEEIRRISHDIELGILTKFGLKAQLEDLINTIQETKLLKVECTTHGLDSRLNSNLERSIYRIVHVLVSNVLNHAKASRLIVEVNNFGDFLNILINDNGIGFDPKKANKKDSLGLRNAAARIHALKGSINIDSHLGKGTTVTIDIPVNN